MDNFANNESALPGRTGQGHNFANGGKPSARGRYSSRRSPWVEVGADEVVLVIDCWGMKSESVAGRALAIGDRFEFRGIRYRVVEVSADHGALGLEVGHAAAHW